MRSVIPIGVDSRYKGSLNSVGASQKGVSFQPQWNAITRTYSLSWPSRRMTTNCSGNVSETCPNSQTTTSSLCFTNLEADLVYGTGGDLALVPPVLRKYWARFLSPGPFGTWYAAAAWHQSLPDQDRAQANKYLGFRAPGPSRLRFLVVS